MNVARIDKARLVGKITKTDEGYLKGQAVVARSGILTYNEGGKIIHELVTEEELSKADSLESLKMKPVTNDHPSVQLLNANNVKQFQVGFTGETVNCDGGLLYSTITINDNDAIAEINAGKRELSCGYTCDLIEESGMTGSGQRYDRIQTNRKYNHVAICDLGRAGAVASLHLDAKDVFEVGEADFKEDGGPGSGPHKGMAVGTQISIKKLHGFAGSKAKYRDPVNKGIIHEVAKNHKTGSWHTTGNYEYDSADTKNDNQSPKQRREVMPVTIRVDGIDYPEQAPEVAKHIERLDTAIATATKESSDKQTKLDAANAQIADLTAKLDAANKEIAALPSKIAEAAKNRAQLVESVSVHLDGVDLSNMSETDIKKAVATKIFPSSKDKIDALKEDSGVDVWFEAAMSACKNDTATQNRRAVNGDAFGDMKKEKEKSKEEMTKEDAERAVCDRYKSTTNRDALLR